MASARAALSVFDPAGVRPTVIVAGIILALFLGAQVVNALIPTTGVGPGQPGPGSGPGPVSSNGPGTGPGPISTPLPPGSSMTIGPLRVALEGGWQPQDVPNSNIIVRLVKANVAIDVISASIQGQADAARVYTEYISSLQGQSNSFGATQANQIQVGNGVPAARGTYTGAFDQHQVEGEVTTFLSSATQGWIFDVWADAGTLRQLLPEADQMINNVQVNPQ